MKTRAGIYIYTVYYTVLNKYDSGGAMQRLVDRYSPGFDAFIKYDVRFPASTRHDVSSQSGWPPALLWPIFLNLSRCFENYYFGRQKYFVWGRGYGNQRISF